MMIYVKDPEIYLEKQSLGIKTCKILKIISKEKRRAFLACNLHKPQPPVLSAQDDLFTTGKDSKWIDYKRERER